MTIRSGSDEVNRIRCTNEALLTSLMRTRRVGDLQRLCQSTHAPPSAVFLHEYQFTVSLALQCLECIACQPAPGQCGVLLYPAAELGLKSRKRFELVHVV